MLLIYKGYLHNKDITSFYLKFFMFKVGLPENLKISDMMFSLTKIKLALQIPDFDSKTAQCKMAPIPRIMTRPLQKTGQPRVGSVLVLFFCKNNTLFLLLTKRHNELQHHPGQISFPGGHQEDKESLLETALRETREEVGISSNAITILGRLESVYVPSSDFIIHPFVAWHEGTPAFKHNPQEVEDIINVQVCTLLDPKNREKEVEKKDPHFVTVPYFKIGNHKVWGATAMILSEFVERIKALNVG